MSAPPLAGRLAVVAGASGFVKRPDMLRAEVVAEAVLFIVTRPPRVRVAELRLLPKGP